MRWTFRITEDYSVQPSQQWCGFRLFRVAYTICVTLGGTSTLESCEVSQACCTPSSPKCKRCPTLNRLSKGSSRPKISQRGGSKYCWAYRAGISQSKIKQHSGSKDVIPQPNGACTVVSTLDIFIPFVTASRIPVTCAAVDLDPVGSAASPSGSPCRGGAGGGAPDNSVNSIASGS